MEFQFKVSPEVTTAVAPLEDPTASPPTLGGPLSMVVIFRFSGVPVGAFNQTTLPVFTTPEDISDAVGAIAGNPIIPAKGTYTRVGNTVEFTPFVPLTGIELSLSAPAAKVPGLFPGSVYTAQVSTNPLARIDNLVGLGGTAKFGTTSNEAAYFPQDPNAGAPPTVIARVPAEGTDNVFPGVFSNQAPGSLNDTFPAGPDSVLLTFDRPLLPTLGNILGGDLNSDGLTDATFFMRTQATSLLVGHEVPANALGAAHASFPAISALTANFTPEGSGNDVVVHGSLDDALPEPSPALTGTPVSMAPGRDPDLLFTVIRVLGDSDLLTVGDNFLGDPSFARLSENAAAGAPDGTLEIGLADVVGLTTLVGGRLVAYDQATRRIYELTPSVVRRRPAPGELSDTPLLVGLAVGDGANGFRSEPVISSGNVIHDLAQSPGGELFALATLDGEAFPVILRLNPIDADANGVFEPTDGIYSGSAADIVMTLSNTYADITFIGDDAVFALNRSLDTIDRLDLVGGSVSTVVTGVGAFDMPLGSFPDGLSPARALAIGFAELDVDAELLANETSGALVRLQARGILPVGADVSVMQRNTLTSLFGSNELVFQPDVDVPALGAKTVLNFSTSVPILEGEDFIGDVVIETFATKTLESGALASISPRAEWATPQPGGTTSGVLRASTGIADSTVLGDFLPQPLFNHKPESAYLREGERVDATDPLSALTSDPDVGTSSGRFRQILLSTDAQALPLANGATPGINTPTTVFGGRFSFRDFIIPEGVKIIVRGSNPFVVTATGRIEIAGMIEAKGADGIRDDSFDSGFLPVRGGPGGPGGGRGGDGHPTRFDPSGPSALDQYVTPERAENGRGPVVSVAGVVSFQPVGGQGAVSTAGYVRVGGAHAVPGGGFAPGGPVDFPDMPGFTNGNDFNVRSETHRPPGGGGGSYAVVGQRSHYGSGSYLVESESTWFPFPTCDNNNDKILFAQYGNDENFWTQVFGGTPTGPTTPLQCVYMVDNPAMPRARTPASLPGQAVFTDGDPDNDYFGSGGELSVLIGGQGGGAGGSRIDSLDHSEWSVDRRGTPTLPGPPFYPLLGSNPKFSPTLYDTKGGGGGGGGGSVQLRSFGDILVTRTGHIDASGGQGGGGEEIGNSQLSGGGGGGSGGAILLQAAGDIIIEADPSHTDAGYIDTDDDAQGASLDVSGGFGKDAFNSSAPQLSLTPGALTWDYGHGDGGQGGHGLIQLQAGGELFVEQGASLYAKQRALIKLGRWNGGTLGDEKELGELQGLQSANKAPLALRYIDLLHYRSFRTEGNGPEDFYYTLNGSYPPIIPHATGDMGQNIINETPSGSGQFWGDTPMMEHPDIEGLIVAREPEPDRFFFEINPPNLLTIGGAPIPPIASNLRNVTEEYFDETDEPELFALYGRAPGIPHAPDDEIPFQVRLEDAIIPIVQSQIPSARSSGGAMTTVVDGKETWDPTWLATKLPVVDPGKTTVPLSAQSRGVSEWFNFSAVALRMRSDDGRTPPFFAPVNGTYNLAIGGIPPGKREGEVQTEGAVPDQPATFIKNGAVDPGLFGDPDVAPFNDIKVDAPDLLLAGSGNPSPEQNAITNNASVRLLFQGAYPVRSGSHVPDSGTLTAWVADLTELDGFPLVRFQVIFDLDRDENQPLSTSSKRPAVDYVRMRPSY